MSNNMLFQPDEQPAKKEPKLTRKQRLFLKYYFNGGKYKGKRFGKLNGTYSALSAYDTDDISTASSIASENLKKLERKTIIGLELNGLSLGDLLKGVKEGTQATKIHSSPVGPDIEVPDFSERRKFTELALKLIGEDVDKSQVDMSLTFE